MDIQEITWGGKYLMNDEIKIIQKLDKNEYFKCSMNYIKKFLGIREIILVALIFLAGMWLYLVYDVFFILILFGVTVFLILVALALFLITSVLGYKHDFEARNICYHQIEFFEDKMIVTSLLKDGEPEFSEEHLYANIDKVAIKRTKIYIYAGVAVFYYITLDSMKEINPEDLGAFLREHISKEKFKIKSTIRRYPKKKKIKLGEE
jgi:hypothetical protein